MGGGDLILPVACVTFWLFLCRFLEGDGGKKRGEGGKDGGRQRNQTCKLSAILHTFTVHDYQACMNDFNEPADIQ